MLLALLSAADAWMPTPAARLSGHRRSLLSAMSSDSTWFGTHAEKFWHDSDEALRELWSPASRGEEYLREVPPGTHARPAKETMRGQISSVPHESLSAGETWFGTHAELFQHDCARYIATLAALKKNLQHESPQEGGA